MTRLTSAQVADLVGYSDSKSLYRAMKRDPEGLDIPHVRRGSGPHAPYVWIKEEVEGWLQRRMVNANRVDLRSGRVLSLVARERKASL